IGVAVADSPNGPWKRFDKPIIDASENKDAPDALMASNPALTQGPDGKFLMVYKAVGKHKPMPFGGPVVHLTAWSDSPTGPFVKKLKPIFTAGEANFPAEDPFIWSQNGKYYAIVKDQGGYFIKHDTRALVLFESYNGEDWFLAPNGYITDVNLLWEDGEVERMAYLERPQLLFEKDKPTALLVAVGNKDMSETYNVQIPLASPNQNTSQLNVKDFHSPSDEYKPMTYYHWQNGHISKEGVKADIESMKDVGLGGFYLFNTAEGMPPGPVKYMSDEWWDVLQYTSEEAHRSGLQMGIMNGAGWGVSGSPWVKPEDSMQEVAWTEKHVTGPSVFEGSLDEPVPCLGFERDMQRDPIKNRRYYVPRDQLVGHYHDIAILAFPTPKGEKAGKPYHIDGWWKKAGYSLMPSWTIDENAAPDEETIQLDDIIDLTDSVTADGYLSWEVPEGDWTILRIGHQPTGKGNHPSVEGGRGLEVDKLSSKALDRYWETSPARMLKAAPKISKVLVDSYEAGYQNWTPGLEKEFERRMGYNPRRYLPAIAGRVITGTRDTERFLWDYRKVVSDLLIENFYNHFAALCHGTGTQFVIEPYGQFGNVDELSNGEAADILVGEFQAGERDGAFTKSTVKLSASLSHFYGKEIVGAESFTNSKLIFTLHPGMLKTQGDHYFCQGMNQLWLHTYVHDPYDKIPGMTLGTYGGHFNRRNTWWKYSKPWFDYLARCQYMLRQGRSKNDILYFMGEDAPARPPRTNELKPNIPSGYDYDLCGGSKCLSLLKVSKDGITAPSGTVYKLLVVKPQK
ncbi:MAG: hypothetical protein J5965_15895, partial [Aeriscardovia sp.]|nr:hypothetical protein [Aeriscardovia sp.]